MGKIYLKRILGGDCDSCFCIDKEHLCRKEFNIDSEENFICSQKDCHYKRIPKKTAEKILKQKSKQFKGESK